MSEIVVLENPASTVKSLCENIVQAIELLGPIREHITIGLSGGSLISQLSDELPNYKQRIDPFVTKLRFLFCDERFVPLDHEDSTFYGFLKKNFFKNFNIPLENVFPIKANSENVQECAIHYEKTIKKFLNSNNGFDILLLGIGPDGHTCSLFPEHQSFIEGSQSLFLVIPVRDSPKPPPERVTLTLPYINNSSYLFFCAVGENKSSILKRILKDKDLSLPSANVRPIHKEGILKWFIDQAASKDL